MTIWKYNNLHNNIINTLGLLTSQSDTCDGCGIAIASEIQFWFRSLRTPLEWLPHECLRLKLRMLLMIITYVRSVCTYVCKCACVLSWIDCVHDAWMRARMRACVRVRTWVCCATWKLPYPSNGPAVLFHHENFVFIIHNKTSHSLTGNKLTRRRKEAEKA